MKCFKLLACMLLIGSMAYAQQSDPVVMKINGVPVTRSEFEYSYNKNNSEDVIDKKSVDEYIELFINYKLKVAAAYDAKMDTLKSFKKEFKMYRDQQIRPSFVEEQAIEAEAKEVYNKTLERIGDRGLVKPAHILLHVKQDEDNAKLEAARIKADSLYQVLQNGADFAELAKKYSQDPGTAKNGGELPWIQPGQTFQEFEDAAYALKVGEMSKPVKSPVGYHIILMKDRKQLEPYDSLRENILRFLEARGVREVVVDKELDELVKASEGKLTKEDILAQREKELEAKDLNLKYLIQEYHDGLLLYEISNRTVWDKAAKDEQGLASFFKKNKKKYAWEEPRFKGMVFHVKQAEDVQAVKDCVKGLAFDKWADKLRTTFNSDSVLRIRVEKGIFKKGDNAFVDRMVFNVDTIGRPIKNYPITDVYGKTLKKPENFEDVRGLVTADYQDMLEKQWVEALRKKYTFEVYREELEKVNR